MKNIKEITLKIRHRIARMIAPKIFEELNYYENIFYNANALPRPMIAYMSNLNMHDLIGIEVGVARGYNALNILTHLQMKKLYLIDSYSDYIENGHLINFSIYKKETMTKFEDFNQVEFIIKDSSKACYDIRDIVDFAYIDGNHSYDSVKKDITNYYRLIRIGGVLGGHDYQIHSVRKAVDEFVKTHAIKLFVSYPDWWFVK